MKKILLISFSILSFLICDNIFALSPSMKGFDVKKFNYEYVIPETDYLGIGKEFLSKITDINLYYQKGFAYKKQNDSTYIYIRFGVPKIQNGITAYNTTLQSNSLFFIQVESGKRCDVVLSSSDLSFVSYVCTNQSSYSQLSNVDILQTTTDLRNYDFNNGWSSTIYKSSQKTIDYISVFGDEFTSINSVDIPDISNLPEFSKFPYHTIVYVGKGLYRLFFTDYKFTITKYNNNSYKLFTLNISDSNGNYPWEEDNTSIIYSFLDIKGHGNGWQYKKNFSGILNSNDNLTYYDNFKNYILIPNRSVFNPNYNFLDSYISLNAPIYNFLNASISYDEKEISLSEVLFSKYSAVFSQYSNYDLLDSNSNIKFSYTETTFTGSSLGGNFDKNNNNGISNTNQPSSTPNVPTSLVGFISQIPSLITGFIGAFGAIGTMISLFFINMPPYISSAFSLALIIVVITLIIKALK